MEFLTCVTKPTHRLCGKRIIFFATRFSIKYSSAMLCTTQKMTKLLLLIFLIASPLRATPADGKSMSETEMKHHMSAQMLQNESGDESGNSECCCDDDDCLMHGCEQCEVCTPAALIVNVQFLQSRHPLVFTPYLRVFDNRQLRPLLHPPPV